MLANHIISIHHIMSLSLLDVHVHGSFFRFLELKFVFKVLVQNAINEQLKYRH